jgi:hypothetical protein
MEMINELQHLYWLWANSPSLLAQVMVALPFIVWGVVALWALGLWTLSK